MRLTVAWLTLHSLTTLDTTGHEKGHKSRFQAQRVAYETYPSAHRAACSIPLQLDALNSAERLKYVLQVVLLQQEPRVNTQHQASLTSQHSASFWQLQCAKQYVPQCWGASCPRTTCRGQSCHPHMPSSPPLHFVPHSLRLPAAGKPPTPSFSPPTAHKRALSAQVATLSQGYLCERNKGGLTSEFFTITAWFIRT